MFKEIELRAQHLITILGSIVNIIRLFNGHKNLHSKNE